MTLVLSNEDVDELLSMSECIEALEEAYKQLALGNGVNRRRSDSVVQGSNPDTFYSLKSMDGIVPGFGVGAVRINSDIVTWPVRDGTIRREKIPAAPGNRWVGLVLLFSTETGEPLAIFPDGYLQRLRVGAANGLGAKYLARNDAKTVALLGSGWQASGQAMAITAVRKVEQIRCYSPNKENRTSFSERMSSQLGIEVIPTESSEKAIDGADIILCATNSIDNILNESLISSGVHISSIKPSEIAVSAIKKSDHVILHTHDYKPMHVVPPGLKVPDQKQGKGWNMMDKVDFNALHTLPELIAGKSQGRKNDNEITCFLNNLGMGYQFAAAGGAFYNKAKQAGRGHELPTEWFTQDVHP